MALDRSRRWFAGWRCPTLQQKEDAVGLAEHYWIEIVDEYQKMPNGLCQLWKESPSQ